jgi:uncharacterized iron-regulated protein
MTSLQRIDFVLRSVMLALLLTACDGPAASPDLKLYDIAARQTLSGAGAVTAIGGARLVLVGEHHTNPQHHEAQLQVIRSLVEDGAAVSIGLEMFRKDQQASLDRWIAGEIDEDDFAQIYLDNWNFAWPLYRGIFRYARQKGIPLVGLNVSRGITRQVAQQGFASLSEAQRGELEGVTCSVTREYRDFIRSAFGAHGHGDMNFVRFCEAQLVWDTAMAINAVNHLERHPERIMVLLAGSAHARKMGISHQVKGRSTVPISVLLPNTPALFDPDTLTTADADFIIMP